jgi:hypothetical protein
MTGDAGRELGAMVIASKEIENHPMAVEGAPWACLVLLAYRVFKPGSQVDIHECSRCGVEASTC